MFRCLSKANETSRCSFRKWLFLKMSQKMPENIHGAVQWPVATCFSLWIFRNFRVALRGASMSDCFSLFTVDPVYPFVDLRPVFPFHTPWKHQKIQMGKGFLITPVDTRRRFNVLRRRVSTGTKCAPFHWNYLYWP